MDTRSDWTLEMLAQGPDRAIVFEAIRELSARASFYRAAVLRVEKRRREETCPFCDLGSGTTRVHAHDCPVTRARAEGT